MLEPTSGLVLGVLLGMKHALEPDHLAAVTVLAAEEPGVRRSALLGAYWGLGHSASLLAVGLVLVLLGAQMPERVVVLLELGVAVMLVVLGARGILRARAEGASGPVTTHSHGLKEHRHAGGDHVHVGAWTMARRPLLVGIIHGLAGSGAITALVVASLPDTRTRLLFLGLFGAGSVAAMAILSGLAGWPLARLSRRPQMARAVTLVVGILSAGVGIWWGWPLVERLLS